MVSVKYWHYFRRSLKYPINFLIFLCCWYIYLFHISRPCSSFPRSSPELWFYNQFPKSLLLKIRIISQGFFSTVTFNLSLWRFFSVYSERITHFVSKVVFRSSFDTIFMTTFLTFNNAFTIRRLRSFRSCNLSADLFFLHALFCWMKTIWQA